MIKYLPGVHFNEEIFEDIALTTQKKEAKMVEKNRKKKKKRGRD